MNYSNDVLQEIEKYASIFLPISDMAVILNMPADDIHPFHGWDCESTVWFNYNWIDRIDKIL